MENFDKVQFGKEIGLDATNKVILTVSEVNKNKNYIIEGLQLFTLLDFNLIKDYPLIIKGTSSFNSLKNRLKRDYQKRKKEKFSVKLKFFLRVIKESRLYQIKHRKKLNKFIVNKERYHG